MSGDDLKPYCFGCVWVDFSVPRRGVFIVVCDLHRKIIIGTGRPDFCDAGIVESVDSDGGTGE